MFRWSGVYGLSRNGLARVAACSVLDFCVLVRYRVFLIIATFHSPLSRICCNAGLVVPEEPVGPVGAVRQ
jgi:hypothetical protein